MQGGNGDTDTENRRVYPVREGESGANGESSIGIYTLSCVKYIASEKLIYNTGSATWFPRRVEWVEGRETPQGENRSIIITHLHCSKQKPTQHCKAIFLQFKN